MQYHITNSKPWFVEPEEVNPNDRVERVLVANSMAATSCGIEWCFPSEKLQRCEVVIYPSFFHSYQRANLLGHSWPKEMSWTSNTWFFIGQRATSAWETTWPGCCWPLESSLAVGSSHEWFMVLPFASISCWLHGTTILTLCYLNLGFIGIKSMKDSFFSTHTEALDSDINVGHWGQSPRGHV